MSDLADVGMRPFGVANATIDEGHKRLFAGALGSPDAPKRTSLRVHAILSCVWAFLLAIQFTPTIRKKFMAVHRWAGRTMLATLLLSVPHLFHLVTTMEIAMTSMNVIQLLVLPIAVYSAIQGYRAIRAHDIKTHRSRMIMFGACFWYFGVTRLCLVTLVAVLHAAGTMADRSIDPAKMNADHVGLAETQRDQFYDTMFPLAAALAFVITFGSATRVAWILPPLSAKPAPAAAVTAGAETAKKAA